MATPLLHTLKPGMRLEGDWFNGAVPENIIAGQNTRIDSAASFKHYRARGPVGLRTGMNATLWRTSLAPEQDAIIEIGDETWIANASLACSIAIRIGKRVFIAGGVTITDSIFIARAASRQLDTVAISPAGDYSRRPPISAQPVEIEDDVWIAYNATILKGIRIQASAVVAPGAVVTSNVGRGCTVSGNPAPVVASA